MAGVLFEVTASDATGAIGAVIARLGDATLFMDEVGSVLTNSAAHRIGVTNLAPDGTPWKPSQRATETGTPTLHLSGLLMRSITQQPAADHVLVGSNVLYAAVHQMGAAKGSLGVSTSTGRNGRRYSVNSPWGDIPARPYLGLSEEDALTIAELAAAWLVDPLEAAP